MPVILLVLVLAGGGTGPARADAAPAGTWRLVAPSVVATSGDSPAGGCAVSLRVPENRLDVDCAFALDRPAFVGLARPGAELVEWPLGRFAGPVRADGVLPSPAVDLLLRGELELRIDGREAGGPLLLAALEDPVFLSDFDVNGLCDWSNILAACDDANVCTDNLCDGSDGSCSNVANSDPCNLPNASGLCAGGVCGLDACSSGYSNCDANVPNGCELDHGTAVNVCAGALNVGSYPGDAECGFFCDGLDWSLFSTQTARAEKWFRAQVVEVSTCVVSIEHRIRLSVPPGIDYDLYAYAACGEGLIGTSTNRGNGVAEEIVVSSPDNPAGNDGFSYYIEVRYYGGASCSNYSLTFEGHNCA